MTERRRRVRLIAWGVSPRCPGTQPPEAPERGRQIAAAASAAAIIFRLSVAASRLEDFFPCRVPGADAPGYESSAASRLRMSPQLTPLASAGLWRNRLGCRVGRHHDETREVPRGIDGWARAKNRARAPARARARLMVWRSGRRSGSPSGSGSGSG